MYNFSQHLFANETILYQGRPNPGKGGKPLGGCLFLMAFSAVIALIMIWSVIAKVGDGKDGISISFTIIFLFDLLFFIIGAYSLINALFLKKRKIADEFYCLTNLRAMKYEEKKNKFIFGYLANFNSINCNNVKDNFGDLSMMLGKSAETETHSDSNLQQVLEEIINPNPENMPIIEFLSIENPENVMRLAMMAKQSILQSKIQQDQAPVNTNIQ